MGGAFERDILDKAGQDDEVPELLTVAEAAVILRCHRTRSMRRSGGTSLPTGQKGSRRSGWVRESTCCARNSRSGWGSRSCGFLRETRPGIGAERCLGSRMQRPRDVT